jgi:hypothetical protein
MCLKIIFPLHFSTNENECYTHLRLYYLLLRNRPQLMRALGQRILLCGPLASAFLSRGGDAILARGYLTLGAVPLALRSVRGDKRGIRGNKRGRFLQVPLGHGVEIDVLTFEFSGIRFKILLRDMRLLI